MWIEVVPSYSPQDAKDQATKAGYIVDTTRRAMTMGMGFGELDPGYILKVEKGTGQETETVRERPDITWMEDDAFLILKEGEVDE